MKNRCKDTILGGQNHISGIQICSHLPVDNYHSSIKQRI